MEAQSCILRGIVGRYPDWRQLAVDIPAPSGKRQLVEGDRCAVALNINDGFHPQSIASQFGDPCRTGVHECGAANPRSWRILAVKDLVATGVSRHGHGDVNTNGCELCIAGHSPTIPEVTVELGAQEGVSTDGV